jgi:Polyketide cyclase / dehydrase and lipid transport
MGEPTDVLGHCGRHPSLAWKEAIMVEVRFEVETPLSPQQVRAAATDFSERRPQIWSGVDPKLYQVHALGDRTAEVTEGSREFGGIWARERYDWSDPDVVVAQVLDSNIFRTGSRWELRVRPTPAGGSRVEWTSLRQPSSLKGRLVVLALKVAGRQHLRGYLQQTLSKLESQTASTKP